MKNNTTQGATRQWLMAGPQEPEQAIPAAPAAPAAFDAHEDDGLAPDPAKLAWMKDSASRLASRIPTSVFALGDLSAGK